MQMMAVLGNTWVNTAELAAVAGVEESDARSLINALSLMRILARSAAATEPAPQASPQTAAAKRQTLFARLRKRLGR
jgi:hypothetical protein